MTGVIQDRALPFVFLNIAMTADGKIAPAGRPFAPFGSPRDKRHLLALRATADAVMAGARTVDSFPVNLGPGPAKYRRLRLRRGLTEYNLRVIVSGTGTIDPGAAISAAAFPRSSFSPLAASPRPDCAAFARRPMKSRFSGGAHSTSPPPCAG